MLNQNENGSRRPSNSMNMIGSSVQKTNNSSNIIEKISNSTEQNMTSLWSSIEQVRLVFFLLLFYTFNDR
jgi:hypothetical protein